MKNSIRSKNIIILILIAILLLTTKTYAANDSFKTSLSVDKSSVERGENITITISVSDISIESGEQGIGAYTAGIEFDSSVFEYVSTNGSDKWEAPFYQDKRITGTTSDGEVIRENQSIGTITLKVKDSASAGDTTIKLTNFSGSSAHTDVVANDSSVKVTIAGDANGNTGNAGNQGGSQNGGNGSGSGNTGTQGGTQNGNGNGSGNAGNQSGTQNGSGSGSQNKNNFNLDGSKKDSPNGTLPQTGDMNVGIYALISIFSLIAIILLIKIKSINKKIKKNLK